ncbi:MAG: hypothetical protein MOB07_13065 [Acidobacteria bacterium]|nr:hypothetical protein [Acidobacteriota bacterium]
MRTVVKVILSQESSESDAARYIAHDGIDPEREGGNRRPLFTNRGDDDFTYRYANSFLNGGHGTPIENDLIHFLVSFEPEDFEALGASDEERKERLREAAREAMEEVKEDLRENHYLLRNKQNLQLNWRWVAGIHLNTDNPHIHFLIHKAVAESEGRILRVGRIPKRLLPRKVRSPDGGLRSVEGVIGGRFVTSLERAQDLAREVVMERGVLDMGIPLLSPDHEFDVPLVGKDGIAYRTAQTFYEANKLSDDCIEMRRMIASLTPDIAKQLGRQLDDLRKLQSDETRREELADLRRNIAAFFPEESRALAEQVKARPDWGKVHLEALETALKHQFAPGTRWHARLRATGDQDIRDGSKENHLGDLLMRLRETREKVITSDEMLLEANRRNPSLAGRELVQEIILRGPAPEPVNPPDALGNIREALKNRQMDDTYYDSQPQRANWLGERSQELRDLYERGAMIKDNVLVIPAEGHELNGLTADRELFINELRYAHREIRDPEKANEFHRLAKAIAGKTANIDTERDYFRYFYNEIKHDGDGRYLGPDRQEARVEALERTLVEMRLLAGEMEKLETLQSIEAHKPDAAVCLEEVPEAKLAVTYKEEIGDDGVLRLVEEENATHFVATLDRAQDRAREALLERGVDDEDHEYRAEPEDIEPDLEPDFETEGDDEEVIPGSDNNKHEGEHEIENDSFVFNTAARKVSLSDERLRFPEGLVAAAREWLVGIQMPEIDRRIENGVCLRDERDKDGAVREKGILSDIDRLIRPERDEMLRRVLQATGLARDEAQVRPPGPDELAEARRILFELCAYEKTDLERRRELRSRLEIGARRDPRGGRATAASDRSYIFNDHTDSRSGRLERLIDGLRKNQVETSAGQGSSLPPDSMLYVSLSNDKGAPRLPIGNIRVYDAIERMAAGARLQLSVWVGKGGPALINGFTEKEYDTRVKVAGFLKSYVHERLRDPETRFIHDIEIFRNAQRALKQARTSEELNKAAIEILRAKNLNWRERALLFSGRAPDHHTPEMRELRHSWGLTRAERAEYVKALAEGRRSPSPTLQKMLTELETRKTERAIRHYRRSIINEEMQNPGKLDMRRLYEGLPQFERDYLYRKIEETARTFVGRHPSLRESAPELGVSGPTSVRASRDNESFRIYLAGMKDVEQSLLDAQPELSKTVRAEIHERACRMAWDRLVLPEMFADPPTGAARLLSDTIAELQERVQPRARVAAQALNGFIREKTGEALSKLESADQQRMEALQKYAAESREELFKGFEMIDKLRLEIIASREGKEAEKISSIAVEMGVRDATADRPSLATDRAPADVSSRSASAPRIDSYREYMSYVAEIERGLTSEALGQKARAEGDGNEITQADRLLTREDRLEIRAIASSLAWERLETQRIFTDDPAVMKLLYLSESLSDTVRRLRDETQPQAREAALSLDEFIRSRNLDKFVESKTGYYYTSDQIPKAELEKLPLADQEQFAEIKRYASTTLGELKDGFKALDKIRLEIDKARSGANGAGKQAPAQIANRAAVAIKIDSLQERHADLDRERMNDRRLLGDVVVAHAIADCAALDHETARYYGNTFRFNIHDESVEVRRRISDLDVHRRADARGDRAADERGPLSKDDRLAIRGQVSEADIHHHSRTLAEHDKKLGKLIIDRESRMQDALDAYQRARQLEGEVIEKYQKRGEPLPAPFVERETLVKTQDEAIQHRFADHTGKLEGLRVELAEEHGQPVRSDQEAARLAAQVFTAGAELKARDERARRFDETRHLRQWKIGGEKFSLAYIDHRVAGLNDAAAVFGKYELHIDPGARKASSAEVKRLGEIRQEAVEKIGRRRDEMRERVNEAGKLFDTLARAYGREAALREQSGVPMPAPRFTREELERAADNIETVRDATLLRRLSVFEGQFKTYADPKERFKPAEGWGRAPARALMAEIFHRESDERLDAFGQRGEKQPLLIETSDGRLITHRLQDTEPKSLIEQIARPLIETIAQRELRDGAQAAFAQYENRLQADFEQTRSYLEAAREIASAQAAERNLRAGQDLPAPEPALTPKQVMTIEIYAERQTDPKEREHFLSLARGSARTDFDSHSHTHSPEPHAEREVASDIGRAR